MVSEESFGKKKKRFDKCNGENCNKNKPGFLIHEK
jgi:hypothetical protein